MPLTTLRPFPHLLDQFHILLRNLRSHPQELRERVDCMPLGSGALSGHSFGLDRIALAQDLNFSNGPTTNR